MIPSLAAGCTAIAVAPAFKLFGSRSGAEAGAAGSGEFGGAGAF